MVAMMAGSDFIKTSTGKDEEKATVAHGIVMAMAIRKYYEKTNVKVGLKPAGGIRTLHDALVWIALVETQLGNEWAQKDFFRIGASSLLDNLQTFYRSLNQ